jgi:hypothetical protein
MVALHLPRMSYNYLHTLSAKVKVKIHPQHDMQAQRAVTVQFCSFLTTALAGGGYYHEYNRNKFC